MSAMRRCCEPRSALRRISMPESQHKQAAQLKKLLDAQKAQDRRWEEALERWQKDAFDSLLPPHDLTAPRFRLWSQNEEDGIIVEVAMGDGRVVIPEGAPVIEV
jgi:hypothetical protein